jgi:hypothetical protein
MEHYVMMGNGPVDNPFARPMNPPDGGGRQHRRLASKRHDTLRGQPTTSNIGVSASETQERHYNNCLMNE